MISCFHVCLLPPYARVDPRVVKFAIYPHEPCPAARVEACRVVSKEARSGGSAVVNIGGAFDWAVTVTALVGKSVAFISSARVCAVLNFAAIPFTASTLIRTP